MLIIVLISKAILFYQKLKIENVYISGLEITEFRTDDKILDYISLMGNNMIPYAIMLGEKYTYFLYHCCKLIEKDKI